MIYDAEGAEFERDFYEPQGRLFEAVKGSENGKVLNINPEQQNIKKETVLSPEMEMFFFKSIIIRASLNGLRVEEKQCLDFFSE